MILFLNYQPIDNIFLILFICYRLLLVSIGYLGLLSWLGCCADLECWLSVGRWDQFVDEEGFASAVQACDGGYGEGGC
jgi:hypothetical protein